MNSGRRNHRTFSLEQLATVLDANAQETSTILPTPSRKAKVNSAAPSTPLVLRKSLSSGRKQTLWWWSAVELKRMSRTILYRILRRDHCSFAVAKRELDNCQQCMQWDQGLELPMQELLGTVRTGVRGVGPRVLASLGRRGVQAPPNRPPRIRALLRYLDEGSLDLVLHRNH